MKKRFIQFLFFILILFLLLSCQLLQPTQEAPTKTPGSIDTQSPTNNSTPPLKSQGNLAQLGPWEISLHDQSSLVDYGGNLPEDGHKFFQLTLLILNTSNTPVLFAPNSLGLFKATWNNYSYDSKNIEALQGYIPPGWPIQVRVIYDLPTIVENPKFILIPASSMQSQESSIDLNSLGSNLTYNSPQIHKLGEDFTVSDRMSITPQKMRTVQIQSGDFARQDMLFLDATIKNLYGYDLQINQEPLVFQLFSEGQISPVNANGSYYYLGGSPSFSFQWFAPPPETEFTPFLSSIDSVGLAPGLEREGSFWMNIWRTTPPPTDMLLLVMYGSKGSPFFQPSQWVLYQLDDNAANLITEPIAPIEIDKILLNEAQSDLSQGNSVAAADLFGFLVRKHPADQDIKNELNNAQQQAGQLVFLDNPSGDKTQILLRPIGSDDSALKNAYEVPGSQRGSLLSPDGKHIMYLNNNGNTTDSTTIIDLQNGQETARRTLSLSIQAPEQISFFTWAPNSSKLLFVKRSYDISSSTGLFSLDITSGDIQTDSTFKDSVGGIAWFAPKKMLAYYNNGSVIIENLESGKRQAIPEDNSGDVFPLAWSSDGNMLYFGTNHHINSLDVTDSSIVATPISPDYYAYITNLFLGPDGRHLVFTIWNSSPIYILDIETKTLYQESDCRLGYNLIGWVP